MVNAGILSNNKSSLFTKLKYFEIQIETSTKMYTPFCNKPTKLQFLSILNTDNFDALQTLRINRSGP